MRNSMRARYIHSSEVMAVKRYLPSAGWALGMLILILDGRTAMAGAAAGVDLCIRTLIPGLFPFFVLSMMLTGSLSGGGLVLSGILGGYPVGAANAAAGFRAGQLSRRDAQRMALISNCPGPSFLFGVLGPVFGDIRAVLMLWAIYLLSVGALWLLLPKTEQHAGLHHRPRLQQALQRSIRAMAGVCGWVILFRVVLAIADRWILWLLPRWARLCVSGVLELSNGCLALVDAKPGLRFVLAAGFISFGGLCVLLQTAGVTERMGLGAYFPGKVFQASFCMLLASLLVPGAVPPGVQVLLAAMGAVLGWRLRKSEKRSGNPEPVIV